MTAARKRDDFEGEALVASRDAAKARHEHAESDREWHRFALTTAEDAVAAAIAQVDAAKERQAAAERALADERAAHQELERAVTLAAEAREAAQIEVARHFGAGSRR